MKCASVPSVQRKVILRGSVRTARNFSPARKVLSMTFPSEARRSFVRTNAPPLPGLTCWNSRTLKTVPSTSMWLPFLNWLVLITARKGSRGDRSAHGLGAHDHRAPALVPPARPHRHLAAVAGVADHGDALLLA